MRVVISYLGKYLLTTFLFRSWLKQDNAYLHILIFLHIIMWVKPKILFLHVPIHVNVCENLSEMNKEA